MPIAGHEFEFGVCRCGRRWVDIRNCDTSDIGKDGIAHMGNLNVAELNQIQQTRDAENVRIASAMGEISGRAAAVHATTNADWVEF